ncbi:MAG: GntR family transcriptional regulator [bacterium]|nr:GntR family transcriptional regulator [bacterium]
MSDIQGLYRLIYRFYRTQIESGLYQRGEPLPAALEISETFNISFSTARKALRTLKNDGYITLSSGRTATVRWNDSCGRNRNELYDRAAAIRDMYGAMSYFLPPVLAQGARCLEAGALKSLAPVINEIENDNCGAVFEFTAFFIKQLGDPVLLHLVCELSNFVHAAFSGDDAGAHVNNRERHWTEYMPPQLFHDITAAVEAGDIARAEDLFYKLAGSYCRSMNDYLDAAARERATGRISFDWRVYAEQERHLYSAAVDLLYRINTRKYPGRWLPPIPELAASLELSEITVRRTIKLLNAIGVTETQNRRGTRVFGTEAARRAVKIDAGVFRGQFLFGLQLLHILALTIENVSYEAFPFFTEEGLQRVTDAVEDDLRGGGEFLTISEALALICRASDSAAIKEIYSKIAGRLIWLYPLRLIELHGIELKDFAKLAAMTAESLRAGRRRDFSRALSQLVGNAFLAAQAALLQLEIKEAAALRLPRDDR